MYRTIACEFWTDDKVRALSSNETLLFLYLITNPHSHYSGLYYLSLVTMRDESKLRRGFDGALEGLRRELIAYDDRIQHVWVRNMFEHQGSGHKLEKGVANHLKTLHRSMLIPLFLQRYPNIAQYCDNTLLIPYPSPIDRGAQVPSSDPVLLTSSSDSDLKSTKHTSVKGRDYRDEAKTILAFLNEKTGKKFREVPVNLALIESRLKSGVDLQTCKTLIARKIHDWKAQPEMQAYLRPETLFGKTKFESYLAEVTR